MPRIFPASSERALILVAFLAGGATLVPAAERPSAAASGLELAEHRTYTETIPGSPVRFDMVAIPGGSFRIGSPPGEKGHAADEGPQPGVRIRPFWMGKCEVTWEEFDLYWKDRPEYRKPSKPLLPGHEADAVTRPSPPYVDETFGYGHDGYPAIAMSHHTALEYCRWLSLKTGKLYRLPTEAEWEYACRAGTTTTYFFGAEPGKLRDYAWFAENAEESTHPVARKLLNPWGLYDMYGNVAEWCLDHYRKDVYSTFPLDRLTLVPVELPTADRFPNVVRGGSWADGATRCRSASRRASDKSWLRSDPQRPQSIWWLPNADFVGFRLARAVEEQDELKELRSRVTKESK